MMSNWNRRERGLMLVSSAAILLVGCSVSPPAADVSARAAWSARKPVISEEKIAGWTAAPEFLHWRQADGDTDGFTGPVLAVHLTGPFAPGAWSQHAGAIFALPRTIPPAQPFTIRFKARSLEGPPHLTVLRTWGGAKPWNSIEITPSWADYQVTLTPDQATETVTFSLVPRKGRLQPYCAGRFELAQVTLVTPDQ